MGAVPSPREPQGSGSQLSSSFNIITCESGASEELRWALYAGKKWRI
jgi:hypothetical protein